MNTRFLGSESPYIPPNKALFHILPVPLEKSVSYAGGTRNAPRAIIKASNQLEAWNDGSIPCERGIYTWPEVGCDDEIDVVFNTIYRTVKKILDYRAIPVVIGGEHTLSYGVCQALLEKWGYFGVVQIDAHADLRNHYENNPYSHACVMRRIFEMDIPIFQLGIRALCKEEADFQKQNNIPFVNARTLVEQNIQSISLPENFPKKVFLSLDIDGLDPSIFPSTGTPVPGGLGWYQTLNLIQSVTQQADIIGFDVVEFSPVKGFHAFDYAAADLVYKIMGLTACADLYDWNRGNVDQ